jgi:hypothetical protein
MQVDPIGLQVDAFDQQFNDAGLLVISEAAVANRRVDFAIWSDALQPVMGNPLLVEVKGGAPGHGCPTEGCAAALRGDLRCRNWLGIVTLW